MKFNDMTTIDIRKSLKKFGYSIRLNSKLDYGHGRVNAGYTLKTLKDKQFGGAYIEVWYYVNVKEVIDLTYMQQTKFGILNMVNCKTLQDFENCLKELNTLNNQNAL